MRAQGVDEGHHAPIGVDHFAHVALFEGGVEHREVRAVGHEVLALQHPEAGAPGDLQEGDQGMVLEAAGAVVEPGVAEVELAPCRAAHEQAREAPGVVQRLHEEGFGGRQAVKEDARQRIPVVDLHAHLQRLDVAGDPGDPLLDRHVDVAPADVLATKGHRHKAGLGDQRGIEALQHHPVPLIAGVAVEAFARRTQLTGGGAQHDRHPGEAAGHRAGNLIDVEVGRHVGVDEGRLDRHGGKRLLEPCGTALQHGDARHGRSAQFAEKLHLLSPRSAWCRPFEALSAARREI